MKKNIKSHFRFNKQERSGIFFLLSLVVLLQAVFYLLRSSPQDNKTPSFLSNLEIQQQIDSLKAAQKATQPGIFSFNPNYLTDYRGYVLGMQPEQIDRLLLYRKNGGFVYHASEFQRITGISDSLLQTMIPYFEFPIRTTRENSSKEAKSNGKYQFTNKKVADLNSITKAELIAFKGIGEVLATRILKFRNALGGFLTEDQLLDVYGLSPEIAALILEKYQVIEKPEVQKININSANREELSKLVYISWDLAGTILEHRATIGSFKSFNELTKIQGFPADKITRIRLYLTL